MYSNMTIDGTIAFITFFKVNLAKATRPPGNFEAKRFQT